ncbi:SDR family NAD(P)-dependent oxidoreductase [Fictibacillus phosphorivorans]|uniref:SDR family NAD(P)-dependent oxidoreductase n=1 Tax=Fictibacillus phosphorivorans TaxID=1221500 RepID=UPI003CEF3C6E
MEKATCFFIPISAKNKEVLLNRIEQLYKWLSRDGENYNLNDIAYTLLFGRQHFPFRAAFVVQDINELKQTLSSFMKGKNVKNAIFSTDSQNIAGSVKEIYEEKGIIRSKNQFNSADLRSKELAYKWANLYLKGEKVNWKEKYSLNGRRIPMPAYPFLKERHQFVQPEWKSPFNREQQKESPLDNSDNAELLQLSWTWEELPFSYQEQHAILYNEHTLLIFDVNDNISKKIHGYQNVILVLPGNQFKRIDTQVYSVNPEKPGDYELLLKELKINNCTPVKTVHLWCNQEDQGKNETLDKGFYSVFFYTKAFMRIHAGKPMNLLYFHPILNEVALPEFGAVSGLVRTIQLENPNFIYKTIGLDKSAGDNCIIQELRQIDNQIEIVHQENKRYVRKIQECQAPDSWDELPLQNQGVYLITGGLGGIGTIIAKYLCNKVKAKLVLIGRSSLDKEKEKILNDLRINGSEVTYLAADISDKHQVEEIIRKTKSKYNTINGVIHSAGLNKDGFIIKKTKRDTESVFQSKIYGTKNLDQSLRREHLDFFVVFSSIASVLGKVGQCDYAFANSYLDYFAAKRNSLWKKGERYGKTISINWPLWKEGNMQIPIIEKRTLAEIAGMQALPTFEGEKAFENAIRQKELSQVVVFYGNKEKSISYLEKATKCNGLPTQGSSQLNGIREDQEKIEQFIKLLLGEEIGLPPEKMDSNLSFDEYGIDSIIINRFNAALEKKIGPMPKTLLFEYSNISDLSKHLLSTYKSMLVKIFDNTESQNNKVEVNDNKYSDTSKQNQRLMASEGLKDFKVNNEENDIAIIGISGRYPQASNIQQFWENMKNGKDCITEIPNNRWDYKAYFDESPQSAFKGKIYGKWGGFIEDVDKFDPLFFNISPKEAETMDPQERLFLETTWSTLENAGYTKKQLQNYRINDRRANIGVFVGATTNTYHLLGERESQDGDIVVPQSMPWSIANRVSYYFDFSGPSIQVDTACSSSLTALHLACESIKRKECSMAIAGGVNLYFHPSKYLTMCQLGMLSRKGKCQSFGEGGDGFVPGEGIGAILLKPLSQALKDHDQIYAVIKGSSINHGGKTNGYSVPNPNAQASLITDTFNKANIDPRTVTCMEAHGTGTALGDPIEIAGLTKSFAAKSEDKQFCSVGSVKTNIGHLEAAAGIAGITKIILQMMHKTLVPSLHSKRLNPNISFENTPFYVQQELSKWNPFLLDNKGEKINLPRRAGISSFGAGGVNVHIILEEFEKEKEKDRTGEDGKGSPQLFIFSAKNETALKRYTNKYVGFLNDNQNADESSQSLLEGNLAVTNQSATDDKLNLISDEIIANYQNGINELQRIERLLLLSVFQKMGVFKKENEVIGISDLKKRLKIQPSYTRLFESLISIMEKENYLEIKNDMVNVRGLAKTVHEAELKNQFELLGLKFPDVKPWADLIWLCVNSYPDVLTGEKKYTDIMFPDGSIKNVENIYKGNKIADYFNKILAIKVRDHIAELLKDNPSHRVNVLEIGAGTGGTSKMMFEVLNSFSSRIQYLYTDISAGFTQFGKREYGSKYSFSDYKVLNIEKDPVLQGYDSESIDIILATNVIHATKSISRAVSNVNKLLKPKGLFFLNEVTKLSEFATLTFGMTTGWWLYEDLDARIPNSPLLSVDKWNKELLLCGIQPLQAIGFPNTDFNDSNQHVIISEKISGSVCNSSSFFRNMAYTLQDHREPMETRLAVIAEDLSDLKSKLISFNKGQDIFGVFYEQGFGTNNEYISLNDCSDKVEQLTKLARLWIAGQEIEWEKYRDQPKGKLVSLPTYPFEQKRYWIPDHTIKDIEGIVLLNQQKTEETGEPFGELFLYQPYWVEKRIEIQSLINLSKESILLFDKDENIFEQLKEKYDRNKSNNIILVKPGSHFRQVSSHVYEINPVNKTDYKELLLILSSRGFNPEIILHLWAYTLPSMNHSITDSLEEGVMSLFHLGKELMMQKEKMQKKVLFFFKSDENYMPPEYASVEGLAKSLRLESKNVLFKSIGLENSLHSEAANRIAEEIYWFNREERTQVWHKHSRRYVKDYKFFDSNRSKGEQGFRIKENGVYLITGGAGGLGLTFAEKLSHEAPVNIILTGRSELSSRQKERIHRIKGLGAKVKYLKCDVSKKDQLLQMIHSLKQEYNQINGVIHTAGVIRDSAFINKEVVDIRDVLASKVEGTVYLDEATKDEPLDFFILFSSLASVIGNGGQSDYAVANSFLDHFSAKREWYQKQNQRSGKTLSLNWPLWKSGGMMMSKETEKLIKNTTGLLSISNDEGWSAFKKAFSDTSYQMAVVKGDREKIESSMGLTQKEAVIGEFADSDELKTLIKQDLVSMVSNILKMEEKDVNPVIEFTKFGFDSITFTRFCNLINEKFKLAIMPSLFYEYTAISSVAEFLTMEFGSSLAQFYKKTPQSEEKNRSNTSWPEKQSTLANKGLPKLISETGGKEPIAIIGMSGIMPGSSDLDDFWNSIKNGIDLVSEIPEERITFSNTDSVRAGLIKDVDKFDPLFFGISPREAEWMDPQQRIFLETVWRTIEDAGYNPRVLSGSKTGLFVGVSSSDYHDLLKEQNSEVESLTATGMAHSIIANRISYLLNLKGPSEPVDTACSSSLVAIKKAADAIRHEGCEMAIAGGINILLNPKLFDSLNKAGMLSEDGNCKTFDQSANGYVRSEGAAALLLKPLRKAEEDGDHIYGVIKGEAVNHGGHAQSLTAPNPSAQAEVIIEAWEKAGLDPSTVSLIETHGTGTKLGDPIEINGLKKGFKQLYKKWGIPWPNQPTCAIGSVKTNAGHLEPAAGIASVVKVLQAMKYKQIPGNLHFEKLNPYIELEQTPFFISDKTIPWEKPQGSTPRRAGISSFGFGGVNAHIVIEEYKGNKGEPYTSPVSQLILLSAKNKERLKEYASNLVNYLERKMELPTAPDKPLVDLERELIDQLSNILKVDKSLLNLEDSIELFGVDLISFATFIDEMKQSFNAEISVQCFSGYPSLSQLARFLLLQIDQKVPFSCKNYYEDMERLSLDRIAYTLQNGREAMEERLAFLVKDVTELYTKLKEFCFEGNNSKDMYSGNNRDSLEIINLFIEGKEGEEFIHSMIQNEKLEKLAKLWTIGMDMDWNKFYLDGHPSRVSLPTYPFAKERYWKLKVPENETNVHEVTREVAVAQYDIDPSDDRQLMLFEKCWKESDKEETDDILGQGTVIILANDETGECAALLEKDFPEKVIVVRPGLQFNKESDLSYVIDYTCAEHGKQLAEKILKESNKLLGVIDLSNVCDKEVTESEDSFGKVVLLQNLIKLQNEEFMILHFTRGLQAFNSGKTETLSGAQMNGLVKMLGAEYKKVNARTIDLDPASCDINDMAAIIKLEMKIMGGESEVCYRKGTRYVPFMQEITHDSTLKTTPANSAKAIVITGGTRGIGAAVAKHLVTNGTKKIVLMGLRDFPPREEWVNIHSHKTDTMQKIKNILELESMGAAVEIYTGSLTNKKKLENFFNKVKVSFGSIGGVIHCAGLRNDTNPAFIHKNTSDIKEVFEPKVKGVEVLQEILQEEELEFFILFSSVAALSPTLGVASSDYSMANTFLDLYSSYQHSKGNTHYKSIAWPSWKEIGMGETKTPAYKKFGFISHSTKEGLNLLDDAMKIKEKPFIMPCVVNGLPFHHSDLLKSPLKQSPKKQRKKTTVFKTSGKDDIKNSWDVKEYLRRVLSEELKIQEERIMDDTHFGEIGVDSILLAELVKKIEKQLNTKLDPSLFLEYPNITLLSKYLEKDWEIARNRLEIPEVIVEQSEPEQLKYVPILSGKENKKDKSDTRTRKIAVIGVGCQFPQAKDKDAYWNNLAKGKNCITEVPPLRWNSDLFYSNKNEKGRSISKWGGFINDIECFDPKFFKFREEVTPHIDPLIRKFLETTVQTVRDAGYEIEELSGKKVGVFVGSRAGSYQSRIKEHFEDTVIGIGQNFIAAHVSHFFNLKGPNLVVDTACSSSLVSLHLACQSLLVEESDMAIAGGVDILLDQKPYLMLSEGRALSPDGKCYTFDERANGFVPGEGAGAVMLKRLDDAIADGDHIYAVIEASAINNDGQTMGITTPNPEAQTDVIKQALTKANIDPGTISYIETHGTGTMIGDPIELRGLTKVFREYTSEKQFCGVGSVKTNIGHLLSAAGIASFIKVVLSLKNKQIPPTLNCETPNTRFDFEHSPFYPVTELKDWKEKRSSRYAGISSFGFGGTNAHIILSETPELGGSQMRHPLKPVFFDKKRYWLENSEGSECLQEETPYFLEIVDEV